LVGAAGFEPTTTSPPGLPVASAGVRWRSVYARLAFYSGPRVRVRAPLLLTAMLTTRVGPDSAGHTTRDRESGTGAEVVQDAGTVEPSRAVRRRCVDP